MPIMVLQERYDEDVVGVGKETDTGYNTSSYMIPAERGFVDFSESKSSALIGILNVGEIVVEVVESGIPTTCLCNWSGRHSTKQNKLCSS